MFRKSKMRKTFEWILENQEQLKASRVPETFAMIKFKKEVSRNMFVGNHGCVETYTAHVAF